MFLFRGEAEIVAKLFKDPMSVVHPFILLPLIGQILLVFTLFQRKPGKVLTFLGFGCLSLLLLFMFVIGILGLNFKTIVSTIPFLITGFLVIRYYRNQKISA